MLHLDDGSTADATPFWLFFKLEYERAPRYVAVVAVCCCCFCYLKLVVWSAGSMDGAAACFRIRSVIVAGWWRCILIPRCSTYKPVYSWSLSLQRLVKYTRVRAITSRIADLHIMCMVASAATAR